MAAVADEHPPPRPVCRGTSGLTPPAPRDAGLVVQHGVSGFSGWLPATRVVRGSVVSLLGRCFDTQLL